MLVIDVTQSVYSGFYLGSLYALMAMGLNMIWGTGRILNFAHGALLTIGAYITWYLWQISGVGFLAAFSLAIPMFFVIGIALEGAIRPLRRKRGFEVTSLLGTIAIAAIIENSILVTFGPHLKKVPPILEGSISTGKLVINYNEMLLAIIAVSTLILVWIFLKQTRSGMAMRAVALNLEASALVGINADRIYLYVLGLSAILAGMAGVLIGSIYFITPTLGTTPFLKAFIIIVFGGLGSTRGVITAAYTVGMIESLSTLLLGIYWATPILFIFIILVLLIRPRGLFGK